MSIIEWQKPKYRVTNFEDVEKYIKAFSSSLPCQGGIPCGGANPCTGGSGECSCGSNCDPLAGGFSCYDFFLVGRL